MVKAKRGGARRSEELPGEWWKAGGKTATTLSERAEVLKWRLEARLEVSWGGLRRGLSLRLEILKC
jgi:hypothetical protein